VAAVAVPEVPAARPMAMARIVGRILIGVFMLLFRFLGYERFIDALQLGIHRSPRFPSTILAKCLLSRASRPKKALTLLLEKSRVRRN
jgi:hypothetical protein